LVGLLELRRRKVQYGLIALIVTLISYLVLMINGLGVGLNVLAGSALKNFDADAIAYADSAGLSVIRSELSDDALAALEAEPGVDQSAAIGYVAANYRQDDGKIDSAAFIGYDPGTIAEPRVTDGRALAPEDSDGLLADKSFLKASGLSIGDTLEVSVRLTTRTFRIVGEIDEGAFFFQPVVYMLRSSWQDLKYGEGAAGPNASVILLKGDDLVGRDPAGFEIVDKATAFANIEGVSGQQSTVQALRLFAYLVGALVIGVFFYVLTLQKVPQIGVLKAIGASNFFVFRQVLLQVMAIAVVGLAVALPLTIATDRLLQQAPDSVPIAFTTGTFVTTTLALLVTAVVGAAFSGRQVLKTDAMIALGQQQ